MYGQLQLQHVPIGGGQILGRARITADVPTEVQGPVDQLPIRPVDCVVARRGVAQAVQEGLGAGLRKKRPVRVAIAAVRRELQLRPRPRDRHDDVVQSVLLRVSLAADDLHFGERHPPPLLLLVLRLSVVVVQQAIPLRLVVHRHIGLLLLPDQHQVTHHHPLPVPLDPPRRHEVPREALQRMHVHHPEVPRDREHRRPEVEAAVAGRQLLQNEPLNLHPPRGLLRGVPGRLPRLVPGPGVLVRQGLAERGHGGREVVRVHVHAGRQHELDGLLVVAVHDRDPDRVRGDRRRAKALHPEVVDEPVLLQRLQRRLHPGLVEPLHVAQDDREAVAEEGPQVQPVRPVREVAHLHIAGQRPLHLHEALCEHLPD
mmetsp:Transcript_26273/g.41632  ORF Transcript_26273/g.41632 Transcript_26273/m.41632 type:complete len:371 (+) Transcript_26273:1526-2638(+)